MAVDVKDTTVRLPEAFLERMRRLLGDEYEAFVLSYEQERVQGLRFNTLKGSLERGLELCKERYGLQQIPWCEEGFYYDRESRPGRHPYHEAGVYYIQEPSAMAVVSLLDPKPGDRVLDLCAAPGGKTTHIAERLCGEGVLVSNEIHPARAKILSQNVERMGITNGIVTNEDSAKLKEHFPEYFTKIVVDAPCSGEGMFRKDEQARNEWSPANVRICADRQREILDNAAAMLQPGGDLVYSTCTFAPDEDEACIAQFLIRHPEFSVVSPEKHPKLEGISEARAEWIREGYELTPELADCPPEIADQVVDTYRIWPHKSEGEGHYLALLHKAGDLAGQENEISTSGRINVADEDVSDWNNGKKKRAAKARKKGASASRFWNEKEGIRVIRECLEEILKDTAEDHLKDRSDDAFNDDSKRKTAENGFMVSCDRLILYGEQIYQVPEGLPPFDGLRVLRPGLHLGTLKKNRLEPSHALALALRPEQVKMTADLPADDPAALSYLNGNTLSVDPKLKGWTLVTVDGYSLGWGKAASGTLKNHYPKGLRIMF
jgi:NOL1/NOP2/sun family putative RNA methylase